MLTTDVAVIGSGLIAQSVALALADHGADVMLLAGTHPGTASPAAAGLLAPSIERFTPAVREFALAARSRFPGYVREIEERAHARIPLETLGILDIALTEEEAAAVAARLPESALWLDDAEIRRLEPTLTPTMGGVLWEEDGVVDNVALLAALEVITRRHERIVRRDGLAESVEPAAHGARIVLEDGETVSTRVAVLAAGAWSAAVRGWRFATAVEPVRGQLIALDRPAVRHPVHCNDRYLVPRQAQTIAGSTMEWVGFVPETTTEAIADLSAAAGAICPVLRGARVARAWAGLRPVTPDRLPLLGPDPENPALIYACGHSRNGILMAPVTATSVCEMVFEDALTFDLDQFRPERFGGTFRRS